MAVNVLICMVGLHNPAANRKRLFDEKLSPPIIEPTQSTLARAYIHSGSEMPIIIYSLRIPPYIHQPLHLLCAI
jgi:hypothetical protein